jgi:hypothetical protein
MSRLAHLKQRPHQTRVDLSDTKLWRLREKGGAVMLAGGLNTVKL